MNLNTIMISLRKLSKRVLLALVLAAAMSFAVFGLGLGFAPTAHAISERNVYAWGWNNLGQLGFDDITNRYVPTRNRILSGLDIAEIHSAGFSNTLFTATGDVYVWGHNFNGQLGLGDTTNRNVPTRNYFLSDLDIAVFRAGSAHNIAVTTAGDVYVWGANLFGQLVLDDNDDRHTPTRSDVLSSLDVAEIHMAFNHSIVLTTGGNVYVWGLNGLGQLGLGHNLSPYGLTRNDFLSDLDIAEIHVAADHSIVLTTAGDVYIWGSGNGGVLGFGDSANRNIPTRNDFLSGLDIAEIHPGGGHTLILTTAGDVYVWGRNDFGQLGLGDSGFLTFRNTPTRNDALSSLNIATIHIGRASYGVVLTTAGDVYMWGLNGEGQLGLGDTTNRNTPYRNDYLSDRDIAAFAFASTHSFAFTPAPVVNLTKTLQTPQGTHIPAGISFDFEFERVRQRLSADPDVYSVAVANVPRLGVNNTDIRSVNLDMTTVSHAGGTTTVIGTLNLWGLVNSLTLTGGNVYVWNVSEVSNSSGLHNPPAVTVTYDDNAFQIRAHTNRYGDLVFLEIFELTDLGVGTKINVNEGGINFLNSLVRQTTEATAFEITKDVTGVFADLTTPFTFDIEFSSHALAPLGATVAARVYNTGTSPHTFVETRNLTVGATPAETTLTHNQRLVIPTLPVGTTISVTERAALEFIPSYLATQGGTVLNVDGDPTLGYINTALTARDVRVSDGGANAIDFINDHQFVPPTGLVLANAPWIAAVLAVLAFMLLAASRKRRSIEQLPMI